MIVIAIFYLLTMMSDHVYNLSAFHEACEEDMIVEIEVDQAKANDNEAMSKDNKVNWDHTPIKN